LAAVYKFFLFYFYFASASDLSKQAELLAGEAKTFVAGVRAA
jgi:hypothetical protein